MKNEEQRVDKSFLDKEARASYERILNNTDAWVHTAATLRRAAEEIDVFRFSVRGLSNLTQKELEILSLNQLSRFLMGISFENLLKAIIIAHGKSPSFKHDINCLIKLVDSSCLNLTDEEKGILIELEEYVLWEGRYPIPKKIEKHKIVHSFSSEQQRRELALWERLFKHVHTFPSVNTGKKPDSVYKNMIRRWGLI